MVAGTLSAAAVTGATVTYPKLTAAEVKLTADDGSILLLKVSKTSYKYAVYNTSTDAFVAVNGATAFYHNDGHGSVSEYRGAIALEFLTDEVTRAAEYVFTKTNAKLVFKSASKTASDGYPHRGTRGTTKISFTNTANRLVFRGEGADYTFENIILDGNNKEAQEGGSIKLGDRGDGSNYSATVHLKKGVAVNPLSFVNDRDTDLTAMISSKNPNLVVWHYPLVVNAVEDYYIDGAKKSATTLEEDYCFAAEGPTSYGASALSDAFLADAGISLNKGAGFSYAELSSNTGVDGKVYPAVKSGITNVRYVNFGSDGGRRWEYSTNR